ncbi:DUF6933 domain-containing protein [Endozoicomonas lisbonensis]|uniref:DUF6933 domain-containing protein n=1 Tax=Endozoicomonas lisbonensis TaxID=3120522 RepID=A0ABV2SFY2_9GAMM
MIIHCSAKLAAKLPAKPPKKAEMPAIGKLQHWHAHFLTYQRRQCVLFCEDETRFMLLAKGVNKGLLQEPKELFDQLFLEALEVCCDVDFEKAEQVINFCGDWQMDTPHGDIQQWLNNRPLTVKGRKGCLWPDKEMKALVDGLL